MELVSCSYWVATQSSTEGNSEEPVDLKSLSIIQLRCNCGQSQELRFPWTARNNILRVHVV